mgnify:CR=1 FL=1
MQSSQSPANVVIAYNPRLTLSPVLTEVLGVSAGVSGTGAGVGCSAVFHIQQPNS